MNGGLINKQKLATFYVLLLLSTVFSAVMLYSTIKQWKRWKYSEPRRKNANTASWQQKLPVGFLKYLYVLPRHIFGLLIILLITIVGVQMIAIPTSYGILIKSNNYPEIEVLDNSFIFKIK